jgi:hypothetical protein
VDIVFLNLFLWLAPTREPYLLALYNGVAIVAANANSYVWNTLWTFRGRAERGLRQRVLFALQRSSAPRSPAAPSGRSSDSCSPARISPPTLPGTSQGSLRRGSLAIQLLPFALCRLLLQTVVVGRL